MGLFSFFGKKNPEKLKSDFQKAKSKSERKEILNKLIQIDSEKTVWELLKTQKQDEVSYFLLKLHIKDSEKLFELFQNCDKSDRYQIVKRLIKNNNEEVLLKLIGTDFENDIANALIKKYKNFPQKISELFEISKPETRETILKTLSELNKLNEVIDFLNKKELSESLISSGIIEYWKSLSLFLNENEKKHIKDMQYREKLFFAVCEMKLNSLKISEYFQVRNNLTSEILSEILPENECVDSDNLLPDFFKKLYNSFLKSKRNYNIILLYIFFGSRFTDKIDDLQHKELILDILKNDVIFPVYSINDHRNTQRQIYNAPIRLDERIKIKSVQCSPDSKYAAVLDQENKVLLFNTKDWEIRRKYDNVSEFEFSPDGSFLIYCSSEIYSLIDLNSLKTVIEFQDVLSFIFSPDGKHIACRKDQDTWEIYSTAYKELEKHIQNSYSIGFTPLGDFLYYMNANGTWFLINTENWNMFFQITSLEKFQKPQFSLDGKLISLKTDRDKIDVLNTITGNNLITIHDSAERDFEVVLSPNGKWAAVKIINEKYNGFVRETFVTWDIYSASNFNHIFKQGNWISYSQSGKFLIFGDENGKAYLYDTDSMSLLKVFHSCYECLFSDDEKKAAVRDKNFNWQIFHTYNLYNIIDGISGEKIFFTRSGNYLAVNSEYKDYSIYNLKTGQKELNITVFSDFDTFDFYDFYDWIIYRANNYSWEIVSLKDKQKYQKFDNVKNLNVSSNLKNNFIYNKIKEKQKLDKESQKLNSFTYKNQENNGTAESSSSFSKFIYFDEGEESKKIVTLRFEPFYINYAGKMLDISDITSDKKLSSSYNKDKLEIENSADIEVFGKTEEKKEKIREITEKKVKNLISVHDFAFTLQNSEKEPADDIEIIQNISSFKNESDMKCSSAILEFASKSSRKEWLEFIYSFLKDTNQEMKEFALFALKNKITSENLQYLFNFSSEHICKIYLSEHLNYLLTYGKPEELDGLIKSKRNLRKLPDKGGAFLTDIFNYLIEKFGSGSGMIYIEKDNKPDSTDFIIR